MGMINRKRIILYEYKLDELRMELAEAGIKIKNLRARATKSFSKGFDEGYGQGQAEGHAKGYKRGFKEGSEISGL